MVDDEEHLDALDAAIGDIDDWLTPAAGCSTRDHREHRADELVLPPSAVDVDGPDLEPVTRLWIGLTGDDEEVLPRIRLPAGGIRPRRRTLRPRSRTLRRRHPAVEAYRPGMPRPLPGEVFRRAQPSVRSRGNRSRWKSSRNRR